MLITLEEAKLYLRVDSSDEDELINRLIETSEKLCMDVARVNSEVLVEEAATTRIAVLYAMACLYEHREEANYKELLTMLRVLLFGVRQEVF
ncbi:phage gp6-like head-tail connector protein [Bacillus sp. APMAM]|nr:phage gp6-like head-tail connector protein [Bacillus sp. APMAM]RTZ55569.1 phage gp6-like head-tail connector protein [Bacillus sp. SAJ1]